jgi:predicted ATP-grasp superfamily ATP-dependent carboligase
MNYAGDAANKCLNRKTATAKLVVDNALDQTPAALIRPYFVTVNRIRAVAAYEPAGRLPMLKRPFNAWTSAVSRPYTTHLNLGRP